MFARVNAVFGVRENARVIPEEAIVPQGGKQFVINLIDGPTPDTKTTQRVEVKVGVRSPGKVEILQGLEAGDTVVTTGQQRLQREGMAVTVVDLSAKPPRSGAAATDVAVAVAGGPAPTPAATPDAAATAATITSTPTGLAATPNSRPKTAATGGNPCGVLSVDAAANTAPGAAGQPARLPAPAGAVARNPA